jgi:hypothetical protein
MCIISKMSEENKQANQLFKKQLRELVLHFTDIEDSNIAQCAINLVREVSKKSKLEAKKYFEEMIKEYKIKFTNKREINLQSANLDTLVFGIKQATQSN